MQPGVSDRYRDSMRPSDSYYTNPYRQDFDYRRAEQARAQEARAKDKLESTQQRIERELLEKILTKTGQLAPDGFILLSQLGKFVFLVVMLPPYVVFYGMPKLVFKKLAVIYKKSESQVSAFFNKFATKSSLFLKKIYTWPQNKILFLSAKIKEAVQRAVQQAYQKLVMPIVTFAKAQKLKLAQLTAKISNPIIHFVHQVSTKVITFVNKMASKIKTAITIPSFTIPLPTFSLKKVKDKWNRLKIKTEELARNAKKKVQEAFANTWRMVESAWFFLWQPLAQLKLPKYQLPDLSRIKEMYDKVTQFAKQITDAVTRGLAKGKEIVLKPFEKLAQVLQHLKNRVAKENAKVSKYISAKWQALKQRVSPLFKRGEGKAKEKWQKFKQKSSEKLAYYGNLFSQKSRALIGYFHRLLKLIGQFFKNLFFSIRIFYAVVCLFFKFAIQGIKDKVAEEL